MPTPKTKSHFAGGANLTGEGADDLAALLQDKASGGAALAAITPLPNGADLPAVVSKVNAILAALKA